jgi:hypothetical protein
MSYDAAARRSDTEPGVSFDDIASVLASVIASNRTAEDVRDGTGVLVEHIQPAITLLTRMKIIREVERGRFHACQARCAGQCRRTGEDVRGQEVVINGESLRWTCVACWDAAHQKDEGG